MTNYWFSVCKRTLMNMTGTVGVRSFKIPSAINEDEVSQRAPEMKVDKEMEEKACLKKVL